MIKYYTRACNFFYGSYSKKLVKNKKTLPLNGNNQISFDQVEIFSKNKKKVSSRVFNTKNIKSLPKVLRNKVNRDLKKITSKKIIFNQKNHIIMGILNMTPDSFSDGGKYNKTKKSFKRIRQMIKEGADIIDVGGESTRPGSEIVNSIIEWKRIKNVITKFKKKFPKTILSVDTRKSSVMSHSLKYKANIVNDVSCFKYDKNFFDLIKNKDLWKVIHHMQGTPQTMQINPKYNHVLLDIYDFFEYELMKFKKDKYRKKIILDPGIGFGKNLKHNLMILSKISIFHSLGFPILVGSSRKRFINQISKKFDTKERLGGTLSSVIYLLSQGVKIFRVHEVGEVKQGILVFEKLLNE